MDQQQLDALAEWRKACADLRAWVEAHPAEPGQDIKVPDALADAVVNTYAAARATIAPGSRRRGVDSGAKV
jgi:hypothetical protein